MPSKASERVFAPHPLTQPVVDLWLVGALHTAVVLSVWLSLPLVGAACSAVGWGLLHLRLQVATRHRDQHVQRLQEAGHTAFQIPPVGSKLNGVFRVGLMALTLLLVGLWLWLPGA